MTRTRRLIGFTLDWFTTMLPAALLVAFIDYTAWCAWWI